MATKPVDPLRETVERILDLYKRHHADPVARAVTEQTLQALASNLGLLDVAATLRGAQRAGLVQNVHCALSGALPDQLRSLSVEIVRGMVRPVTEALLHAEYLRQPQIRADRFTVPVDWERLLALSLLRDLTTVHLFFAKIDAASVVPLLKQPPRPPVNPRGKGRMPVGYRHVIAELVALLPGVGKPQGVADYVKEALRKPRDRNRG